MEENVSNALLMAAAMLIFVIAVSLTFSLISQTKETSDHILYSYDDTKYYEEGYDGITYTLADENNINRVVNMEVIIPTVYRYIKEGYGVTIIKENGEIIARFDSTTESLVHKWRQYINSSNHTYVDNYIKYIETYLSTIRYYVKDEDGKKQGKDLTIRWPDFNSLSAWEILWTNIYGQSGGANNIPYGAQWEGRPQQTAQRLKYDFGGGTLSFNNNYVQHEGLNLLGKYYNKTFIEVYVFCSDNEGIETDEETGDSVITKSNSSKLEIIYVMEE